MKKIRENPLGSHPIPEDSGRFLKILLRTCAQPRDFVSVLEVGTGVGYSTLWLVKGLIDSGTEGKIYTIEMKSERAEKARFNLRKAARIKGLEKAADYADVIHGNALDIIPEIDSEIDFVFIDGLKEEYLHYLEFMVPRLKHGALITADNVASHKSRMEDFLQEISNHEKWDTMIIPIDAGISLSIKKF